MGIFTFFMDYQGESHLSQVQSDDDEIALQLWLKELKIGFHPDFDEATKSLLLNHLELEMDPVPIQGLVNVWWVGLRIKKIAEVYYIKTCE